MIGNEQKAWQLNFARANKCSMLASRLRCWYLGLKWRAIWVLAYRLRFDNWLEAQISREYK